MKLTKLASTAIVAALALWTSSADAVTTYQFQTLNFSLTARQQGLDFSNSAPATYISTVKTSKITSKDFLSFLATAFKTNWPTGAQLALDNNSRDIFVVDKTGTNPVFNASIGINVGDTNVAFFTFDYDSSVFAGKEVDKVGGGQSATDYMIVFFRLFNETNGVITTDLSFQGFDVTKIGASFGSTTETISVSDAASVAGDGTISGKFTVVNGKATASGKWKGVPPS